MKRARVTEELAYGSALERLTGADRSAPAPPQKEPNELPEIARIKLSVFLNGAEDAYLETLASTAKFSGGKKLSKTRLIAAMVRAFSATNLDVRGVKTDEELFKRVTAQLR
ncbi:MAG: hypothetical protein HYU85_00740 [Chloroflexi bacterium]|nr:hypothetical protein [Chloroflexota bacterium]